LLDLSSALGLTAVVVLVVANGFFVATEFAVVAVRRSRLEQLAAEGRAGARAARDVVGHLDAYIAACQFGITLASLGLGWLGEPAFAHLLEPLLERLIGSFAPAAAHGLAIAIAFAIITALHIVIGELAPKGLALQRAEATALWVARPMQLFYALFRWPITLLNRVGNGTLQLFGLEPASGHEMVHSVEELRYLVTGMQHAGVVEASEARIATRAFQFADLTAGALMTPRTELAAIRVETSFDDLLRRAKTGQHDRLVVYEETLDDVVGVLYVRDLVPALDRAAEHRDLRGLVRPVLAVPASKAADDLLDEMRQARRHAAVVIDEFGGTAGLVTLSNLMAALVGRIEDEPPPGATPEVPEPPAVDGSVLLDGLTRLGELEELLGARLDAEDHDQADTLGGLVMARLGRIPEVGDAVEVVGRPLRVEELDGRRVAVVRLLPAATVDSTPELTGPQGGR
jgi:putative hemolysin